MASALEQLFFTITLLDKVSGPSKGVCKSFQNMQREGRDAFQLMGKGTLGITTSAIGLERLAEPARGFTKSLKEVSSLDTPVAELDKLAKASKQFTRQFGGDAAAIARSAYDIQSAIPGLAKGALAAFTVQGNLLAKATKADAATITKFQGTMYNIFEKSANQIGQAKWVEMLTGKTAHAVKIFKTTGNDMSAAFTNLGSIAEKAGVSLDEQLAVLGTLQGTMGGANAGTAYKAFLNTVGRAQLTTKNGETLKFTDESGKLLPMVKILEKIRAAVGPGQLKLADQTKLMQAFGDEGGKAVLNLLDKTENLKGSIGNLSKITDAGPAVKMAKAMTDQLDVFKGNMQVLMISIGQGLLPIIDGALRVLSKVINVISWLIDNIPGLKYVIGLVVIAISALTMAMSVFYIVMGGRKLVTSFVKELQIAWLWCLRNAGATNTMTFAQRLNAIGLMLWGKALQFCKVGILGNCKALLTMTVSMIGGLIPAVVSGSVAVWGFAAALWATGIPEIVLAIAALVAGVVLVYRNFDKLNSILPGLGDGLLLMLGPIGWIAELIKNWNDLPGIFTRMGQGIRTVYDWIAGKLCAAFRWVSGLLSGFWDGFKKMCPNIANLLEKLFVLWWEGAKGAFRFWRDTFTGIYQFTAGIVKAIGGFFTWLWRSITEPLSAVWAKLSGIGDFFAGIAGRIGGAFSSVFSAVSGIGGAVADTVTGIFSSVDGWIGGILRTVSKIPGLGFLNPDIDVSGTVEKRSETVVSEVTAARKTDIPAGGVRNTTTNNNFGGVRIYAAGGMGPGQLEEWALLQG